MTEALLPHVLLVDDDTVTRLVAKALLEKNGFRVSQAADGGIAMDLLGGAAQFALIVLDVNMPVLTGPEVLQKVRSSTATASIPVLFLTGSESDELEASLMEQGANGCIRKPITPAPFLDKVKATLRPAVT